MKIPSEISKTDFTGRQKVIRALEIAEELHDLFGDMASVDIHQVAFDDVVVDAAEGKRDEFAVKRLSPATISLKRPGISFFVPLAVKAPAVKSNEQEEK